MHISFSIIYLLQEQQLNPRNYSKKELIMSIFIYATKHDINMHAKIQSISKYSYL
jgi:hypothetical protein